jgi:hypothetical protein
MQVHVGQESRIFECYAKIVRSGTVAWPSITVTPVCLNRSSSVIGALYHLYNELELESSKVTGRLG